MDNSLIDISKENEEQVKERTNEIQESLKNSPEVINLAERVTDYNTEQILKFGEKPAQEISTFADNILHSISSNGLESSNTLLKQLTTIMNKFDKKDFDNQKRGFFSKLFSNLKKDIDKILSKYKTLGDEIDGVYVEIKKYENQLGETNKKLETMYDKNLNYYQELSKYIEAGNIAVKKTREEKLLPLEQRANNNEQEAVMQLTTLNNILELLEQRVHNLQMAQVVAFQTAPQIRMIQKTNQKLLTKMNSAFVVTIPIFKNAMITQISLKKQKLAAEGMEALDDATNKLLLKNAEDISKQSVQVAKMAGNTAISIETLEKSFNTIMKGIEDTKSIEEESKQVRKESIEKLSQLKDEFMTKLTNV